MSGVTSELKGRILLLDCEHSQTYRINVLKIIVTKGANKITRLMGLTIMQASKNFKSNSMLRIFVRSNSISENFMKHMNNWG